MWLHLRTARYTIARGIARLRRTNSIIEKKIDFFQNDNRFLEKNEINIPKQNNNTVYNAKKVQLQQILLNTSIKKIVAHQLHTH